MRAGQPPAKRRAFNGLKCRPIYQSLRETQPRNRIPKAAAELIRGIQNEDSLEDEEMIVDEVDEIVEKKEIEENEETTMIVTYTSKSIQKVNFTISIQFTPQLPPNNTPQQANKRGKSPQVRRHPKNKMQRTDPDRTEDYQISKLKQPYKL